jgi:hypothetical protein
MSTATHSESIFIDSWRSMVAESEPTVENTIPASTAREIELEPRVGGPNGLPVVIDRGNLAAPTPTGRPHRGREWWTRKCIFGLFGLHFIIPLFIFAFIIIIMIVMIVLFVVLKV